VTGKQRLDVAMVERGLVPSRARAAARILAGDVVVNDHRVDKAGAPVAADAVIRLKGEDLPWVSRGGTKLEAALHQWPLPLVDAVAIDVGASTGGFTDVLLQRGVREVFAIDVGRGQLHERLRQDPRVHNLEQTHIGKLPVGTLMPAPTIAVVDVSFISLRLVLPVLVPHLHAEHHVVTLIKPQFEAGRAAVGKGGIVRDEAVRARCVADVLALAATVGLSSLGVMPSPITGADGNVEFLAAFAAMQRTR
jgi:23S rRNA (cytidine1920-2'-O)/16S rRNA (cytidine1409-2'-O)-methyltransferase